MNNEETRNIHVRLDNFEKRLFDANRKVDDYAVANAKAHEEIMSVLKPMSQVFINAQGFKKVSVVMLKGIILVGSAVTVIYGVIKWLKN